MDYERLVEEINNKYICLKNGNLMDFFYDFEMFQFILCLAYTVLSKEELVDKNKNNNDDLERLNYHISEEKINYLFSVDFCDKLPIIHRTSNSSSKWIFDCIRDSVMHGLFDIDVNNKLLKINNNFHGRNLICDIPFKWFIQYINYDILNYKTVEQLEIRKINIDKYVRDSFMYSKNNKFSNVSDIQQFINNFILYKINISGDNFNKKEIENFINNYLFEHYNENSFSSQEQEEFSLYYSYEKYVMKNYNVENYEKILEDFILLTINDFDDLSISRKEIMEKLIDFAKNNYTKRNDTDINEKGIIKENYWKFFWKLKRYFLLKKLKKKYLNLEIRITEFNDKMLASKIHCIFNNDSNDIFSKKCNFLYQCNEVINRVLKYYELNNERILECMKLLNNSYNVYSTEILQNENYQKYKAIIEYVFNDNCNLLLEKIHDFRKNEINSYDRCVISEKEIDEEDYDKIKEFISIKLENEIKIYFQMGKNDPQKNYTFEEMKNEYFEDRDNLFITLQDLKECDFKLYEKYNERLLKAGRISTEDLELFSSELLQNSLKIRRDIDVYNQIINLVLVSLIGVVFAVNKETKFDINADYDNINIPGVVAYSKKKYDTYQSELQSLIKKKDNYMVNLEKFQENLLNCNSDIGRKKIQQKINNIQHDIEKLEEYIYEDVEIKEFGKYLMKKCNSRETATIIRDCFAHIGRIKFFNSNRDEVQLIDFNNDGTISGILVCNIEDLLNYFKSGEFIKHK